MLGLFVCLALAPFLFPGVKSLSIAAKVCYFIVLAASYDLLLGYTGIVSFAHTMFFGIGAYSVALMLERFGASFTVLAGGVVIGLLAASACAVAIGALSLRLRTIFFAMVTLAFAAALANTVTQLYWLTGGEDGLSYRIPKILTAAARLSDEPWLGVQFNGKLLLYYVIFLLSLAMFLLLLRIVNSPFGTVLKAIRENEFRAAAIGYTPAAYRTLAAVIAAAMAAAAGCLAALWLRYTGPGVTFDLAIAIDILLMVVIGGKGTMYGAALGAALIVVAQGYLQVALTRIGSFTGSEWLAERLFDPDRWLLWLGLLFVLSVYFFPTGIIGRLRQAAAAKGS